MMVFVEMGWIQQLLIFQLLFSVVLCVNDSAQKKKKDIRDFNDADIERLYEEWEENDDDVIPDDEKPDHEKPKPDINIVELKEKVFIIRFNYKHNISKHNIELNFL